MTAVRLFKTPLGPMTVAAGPAGVIRVTLPGSGLPSAFVPGAADPVAEAVARQAEREILAYFAGKRQAFAVPVDLAGVTPFRRKVLEATRRIPYGRTTTYGNLAKQVGSPRAVRAVGGAMAANPVPILIPCHRVLAAGGLGGYGGGLALKRRLLALEGAP